MPYTIDVEKIELAIFLKKLSKRKVAEKLKMSPSSLSRKLQGKSEFSVGESGCLCDLLELNPTEIFLNFSSQKSNEKIKKEK